MSSFTTSFRVLWPKINRAHRPVAAVGRNCRIPCHRREHRSDFFWRQRSHFSDQLRHLRVTRAPPTSVATTGCPAAMYSRIAFEKPSNLELQKKCSILQSQLRSQPAHGFQQLPFSRQHKTGSRNLASELLRCAQKIGRSSTS